MRASTLSSCSKSPNSSSKSAIFNSFTHDDDKIKRNNGNNKFVNVAENYNVDSTDWAWGARFSDFDLDGDLDLFYGYTQSHYFENKGTHFVELTDDIDLNDFLDRKLLNKIDRFTGSIWRLEVPPVEP